MYNNKTFQDIEVTRSFRFGSTGSTNIAIFDGDSRTVGYTGGSLNYPYSDQISLADYTKYNTASGGATITNNESAGVEWLSNTAYSDVDSKYNDVGGYNIIIIWIGYNDMSVQDKNQTDTFEQLQAYCLTRRARGWKILVCTESDFFSVVGPSRRNGYNNYIKSQWRTFADGIVNIADNEFIGGDAYETDPTYQAAADIAIADPTTPNIVAAEDAFVIAKTVTGTSYFYDGTHMSGDGYDVVASLVGAEITKLMTKNKIPEIKYSLSTKTSIYAGCNSGNDTTAAYNTGIGFCVLSGLTTGAGNIGLGFNSLTNTTIGNDNIALGCQALGNNVSGSNNVALGNCSLNLNTGGTFNIGIGYRTLCSSITGTSNTAIGYQTLASNTFGDYNIGIGFNSLLNNTIGNRNIAIGHSTLEGSCASFNNIAIGEGAMTDTAADKGNNNIAIGINAMRESDQNACYNVAIGYEALYTNGADDQVAIGKCALYNVSTGSNNIAIGTQSGSDGMCNITGATSNHITMGNNSVTNALVKVAWTVTSDIRDKTCINIVSHGLDFINKIKPISFKFNDNREDNNPVGDRKYGISAQEVLKLEGSNSVIIDNKDLEHLKYNESSLIAVLVNAINELTTRIRKLENK